MWVAKLLTATLMNASGHCSFGSRVLAYYFFLRWIWIFSLLFLPSVIVGFKLQSCSLDFKDANVIQVGEAIPLRDASVDAVVGTLVLCSVKDVDRTLKGTQTSTPCKNQNLRGVEVHEQYLDAEWDSFSN